MRPKLHRYTNISDKLAEYTIRLAVGFQPKSRLEILVGESLAPVAEFICKRIAAYLIKERNGLPWCRLCDKGPFTKRGLYLHLKRIHMEEIKYFIEEELERALWRHQNLVGFISSREEG